MVSRLRKRWRHFWQSSVTGRFVSKAFAKANPGTTEEKKREID